MYTYERELLKGSTDCLILSVLNDHPTYGYELIREIETRSNGYFHFREGTLYPALHRMEKDGLLKASWNTLPGGQERRYYHLTESGREALALRQSAWSDFSSAVKAVLKPEIA